jgi:RNA polymerase sigma-70 factor (ECF subfamily)
VLNLSDAELVRHAQGGSKDAAGELYDRHNEPIFRYVWSRVYDRQTAEDLTGEIFARVVANLSGYRSQGVPFRAWLYRIAHNLVVDHHRKQGGRELISLEHAEGLHEEGNNPDSVVEHRLATEQVRHALESLDPPQREVVKLRFLDGLSLNEVALTLDKSVPAVKSLQYRGLIGLRALLNGRLKG